MEQKHILGKKGETIAKEYLLEKSYSILEENWRYLKAEIDLIAQKEGFIVFVEVKTRSSNNYGDPESFVSDKQQKMIIHAANEYIMKNDLELEARFDIISIIMSKKSEGIRHIEGAFYPRL
jgi:putative endonuclease